MARGLGVANPVTGFKVCEKRMVAMVQLKLALGRPGTSKWYVADLQENLPLEIWWDLRLRAATAQNSQRHLEGRPAYTGYDWQEKPLLDLLRSTM